MDKIKKVDVSWQLVFYYDMQAYFSFNKPMIFSTQLPKFLDNWETSPGTAHQFPVPWRPK